MGKKINDDDRQQKLLNNVLKNIEYLYNKRANMEYQQYIERNPDIMLGKPIIKGTRITVELIMRKLADGYNISDLLKSYPHLTKEQILAALEYVADMIANEDTLETA